jgi:hypothetical protein
MTDYIPQIPCQDCICFAICNSIVKSLDGVYKVRYITPLLIRKCDLFRKWNMWSYISRDHGDAYLVNKSQRALEEKQAILFCECFGLKQNIKPDYNLIRHISEAQKALWAGYPGYEDREIHVKKNE